jgi:uncharacterized protein involved in cysteine biosynthesis
MLKSTLIGGALFGFIGAIPLLNMINCACCALVVAGGFLASYLYSRECRGQGVEFRAGGGALVGLVAGLFYAIMNSIIGGIVSKLMPTDVDQLVEMLEQFDVPPESIDIAVKMLEGSGTFMGMLIGFFVVLLIAAVFSTIGGLIGGAVFKVIPEAPPSEPTMTS